MADAARNYQEHEEFWKPVTGSSLQTVSAVEAQNLCLRCRAALALEAKFCHRCGTQTMLRSAPSFPLPIWLDLTSLCLRLGQTTPSLIALILGCSCLAAAVLTGFVFTVANLTDWQAVQSWRIQWLLAAIALFVAGILLKPRRP